MTIKIKHKRSAVSGKQPLPADLDFGEIAVNYHASGPAIYLKDTAGAIRKVGSLTGALVFKGSKAPGDAAPGTPASGDVWVMSAAGVMAASWIGVAGVAVVKDETIAWDGSEWISLGIDPPTPDATETTKGIVELATAAETTTGTDATRAVHPAGLKVELDKLKHWSLNGTKLTAQESGGTKRGASLDFASCLPNGASHILTDNNTHFIAEYRSTSGKVITSLPNPVLPPPIVATLDVTGIDTIFAVAGVAFNFEGGSDNGAIGVLKLFEKGGTAPLALASQGCSASGLKTPNYQLAVTTHFTKKDLDPNKTYTLSLYAGLTVAQGPISAWDPSLSVFGLKIKA